MLDEAVPGRMLQHFAGQSHVGPQGRYAELGHLVGQLLQKLVQHLVVDAEHIRLTKKRQYVLVVAQQHVVVGDLGQLAAVELGQLTVHQHLGGLGKGHYFGCVDLKRQAFKVATPYANGDVIVKAFGRLQGVSLDFGLGGALEDVTFCVVAYPPITGCWDLENHQLARIARNARDGVPYGH